MANSYGYLGLAYYIKRDLGGGTAFIKTSLTIDKSCYQAWANLGEIHLERNNYYEAFLACLACLKNDNRYIEGITLYKKLVGNLSLNILSYILPKLVDLGYRKGFIHLDGDSFPQEFLKEQRFVSYSNDFQNFFSKVSKTFSKEVVAIYGALPKCSNCKGVLKIWGDQIDLKNNRKTYFYRCTKCGFERGKGYPLHNKKKDDDLIINYKGAIAFFSDSISSNLRRKILILLILFKTKN